MAETTVITGDVDPAISITVPAAFTFTMSTIGENNAGKTLGVISNAACKVTVHEDSGDGVMESPTKGTLANALVVDATDDGANTDGTPAGTAYKSVTLSGTAQDLFTCSQAVDLETTDMNIDFEQTTTYADDAADDYTITVTFTASNV